MVTTQEQAAGAAQQLSVLRAAERRLNSLRPNMPVAEKQLLKLLQVPVRTRVSAMQRVLKPRLEAAQAQSQALAADVFLQQFRCKFVSGMAVESTTYRGAGLHDNIRRFVLLDIRVEYARSTWGVPIFIGTAMSLLDEGNGRTFEVQFDGDDTVVDLTP